jgi:beta,beta-carotene 9',10'-dioxygenase
MNAVLLPPEPAAVIGRGKRRGFETQDRACEPIDLRVSGRLPDWLCGSLLLNGPAVWELARGRYAHWFDGLALLHRVQIDGQRVRYHSRFIDSEDARLSRERGRSELGGFDTPVAGGLLSRILHIANPRRTDNTAVVLSQCDGQWLAHTESDRVQRIDPDTLATLGEQRWADKLKLPLMAAHPCVDARGGWWNVGIGFGRMCEYVLVQCDRSGERRVKARIPIKRPGYLHAFAMTPTHAVIWDCAWRAHPLRFLFAGEPYARHFDWLPQGGSRLFTVRLSDGRVRAWEAPPLMVFHAVQAFDAGDDVVVDLCRDDAPLIDDLAIERLRNGDVSELPASHHTRFVLSQGRSAAREEALPGRFDLPQVNLRVAARGKVRYVWGAAPSTPGVFFDRTLKLDHASGELTLAGRDDRIALEPLFVPEPGASAEDAGVLLVHTLGDADPGSRIRVLDAATLDEQAAIEVPHVIPFGFHGAWRGA